MGIKLFFSLLAGTLCIIAWRHLTKGRSEWYSGKLAIVIERSKNPWQFWCSVSMEFALAGACLILAIVAPAE